MKKTALMMLPALALICIWGVMSSSNVSIMLNGQVLSGPFALLAGIWGFVVATVVLFCVAILLTLILGGVGLVILGVLSLTGLILVGVAFPFLLPLLIPLFIVWAICATARRAARKGA